MKKGRHRRFEEARALKRLNDSEEPPEPEPCVECGSEPGDEHASWCLAGEESLDDEGAEEEELQA